MAGTAIACTAGDALVYSGAGSPSEAGADGGDGGGVADGGLLTMPPHDDGGFVPSIMPLACNGLDAGCDPTAGMGCCLAGSSDTTGNDNACYEQVQHYNASACKNDGDVFLACLSSNADSTCCWQPEGSNRMNTRFRSDCDGGIEACDPNADGGSCLDGRSVHADDLQGRRRGLLRRRDSPMSAVNEARRGGAARVVALLGLGATLAACESAANLDVKYGDASTSLESGATPDGQAADAGEAGAVVVAQGISGCPCDPTARARLLHAGRRPAVLHRGDGGLRERDGHIIRCVRPDPSTESVCCWHWHRLGRSDRARGGVQRRTDGVQRRHRLRGHRRDEVRDGRVLRGHDRDRCVRVGPADLSSALTQLWRICFTAAVTSPPLTAAPEALRCFIAMPVA